MITDLNSLRDFLKENIKNPVLGVAVYAFERLGLEDLLPEYRLLALRYSLDTELIEKDLEVLSLEKGMGTKHLIAPRNSTAVLSHPKTKEYLKKFKRPVLIPYKSSSKMEKICEENDWILAIPPFKFGKELFEDKIKFRKILEIIGVPSVPGKTYKLLGLDFEELKNKWGLPFFIQHPGKGGGKGNFLIKNEEDFKKAKEKLTKEEEELSRLEVIVAQYISGLSPSITGCVTSQGILSTRPQYQLIDIPELYRPEKGAGLFCGHDWSSSVFSEDIENQAYQITQIVGNYFQSQGYRGIFGLDFIIDDTHPPPGKEKLYVTECNPRLLATFPTIAMVQLRNNEPPIIAFHLLEYLGIDYEIDVEKINNLMHQKKEGSQMFLHNLTGEWARNHNELRAGIYKIKSQMINNKFQIQFLRPGYKLSHLKNENEFLITDGVPIKKSHFSPNRRLCRILTLNRALNGNKKQLNLWTKKVVETTYTSFNLKPVRFAKLIKFFNPNYLAKG